MSAQLLVVLRVCLLVFIYLVFLRILRAVWVEMKGAATVRVRTEPVAKAAAVPVGAGRGGGSGSTAKPRALVQLAPAESAGASYPLEAETTIGRAAGCRIAVDDTHVSKVHARVFVNEGRWYVEDLGSTNGTLVNETLVGATTPLDVGDRIRVGETVLELR